MAAKVKTNTVKDSTAPVPHDRKVRLLLWGGAYKKSDNFTFEWGVINVAKDYSKDDGSKYKIIKKKIGSAEEFLVSINSQADDNIRSLDLFTHGGPDNFYMVSVHEETDGGLNTFKWYRYAFHDVSFSRDDLKNIQFSKFTVNAKIEIHGCKTASNAKDEDNIAADLSKKLYEAGKIKSVVIAHIDSAGPGINGEHTTKEPDQDYRFGQRAIFKKGRLVEITTKMRALDEEALTQ